MLRITFECTVCEKTFVEEIEPPVDLQATPIYCPDDPLRDAPDLIRMIRIELVPEQAPAAPPKGPLDAIYAGILRHGEEERS